MEMLASQGQHQAIVNMRRPYPTFSFTFDRVLMYLQSSGPAIQARSENIVLKFERQVIKPEEVIGYTFGLSIDLHDLDRMFDLL